MARTAKAKVVGYGLQLREKQKTKRMYFTLEISSGIILRRPRGRSQVLPAKLLLQQLERRLDNVVYRLGFCHVSPSGATGGAPWPHRRQRTPGQYSVLSGEHRRRDPGARKKRASSL